MAQNPDWPLIDEAVSFPTGPNSPMPAPYWCSVTARTEGSSSSTRGRQYELDETATGVSSATLRNDDAAFDDQNAASPFYPQVTPYRAHRRRAQYPATVNLLTADQATAGAASGLALGAVLPKWVSSVTVAVALVASPYANAYAMPVGASGTGVALAGFSVVPGGVYSVQCMTQAVAAGDTFVMIVQWRDATGAVLSTSTSSVGSTTAPALKTVTVTAPAGACGARVILGGGTAGITYAWNVQLELAAAASAWVQPGVWFDMITDYVERWPQSWTDGGTYGTVALGCIDALGYLSQTKLLSPAYEELLALGPAFLYPLDEAAGSVLFYDLSANLPAATEVAGQRASLAQIRPGTQLASTSGVVPAGIGGPTVHFNNQTGAVDFASIVIPDDFAALAFASAQGWSRVIAVRSSVTPESWANPARIWYTSATISAPGGSTSGGSVSIFGWGNGFLFVEVDSSGSATYTGGAAANPVFADGQWHMTILTCSADGKTFEWWYDGTLLDSTTLASDGRPLGPPTVPLLSASDQVGAANFPSVSLGGGFEGEIACVTQFPFALSAAQVALLWSTFRYGGSGLGAATSATRYADVLRWGGWAGLQAEDNFQTGQTVAYGPASELLAAADQSGTDVVSALQQVVATEGGSHFVAKDGTLTLKARRARYNQPTPVVIFGENVAGGEIPYVGVGFGLDPTLLGNDVSVTQTATGNTSRVFDAASIRIYGDVPLQRNVNSLQVLEVADAANYLLQRNKIPARRVEAIVINVGALPAAWPVLLGLELGSRVRVNRRPPGVPAIDFDGFVEKITWALTDQVTASCTLEISPVGIGQNLSQLTATRGPLNGAKTVGATSIVVNVATDAAGNTPRQNGWTADAIPSLQIVDGAAATEIVAVTGPMTYAGQLVTIPCAALVFGHAAGVVVAENPGVYTYSQFDAVALLDGTHALAY